MRPTTTAVLALLLPVASADFFVSNTSVCMGTFLVQNCVHGVKVLTGIDPKKDYVCSKLVPAEDNNYVHKGTMGPTGSPNVASEGGVCGSGKLDFEKNGEDYIVKDVKGANIGACTWDNSTHTDCNQWLGMLYFQSMYRCTGACT